MSGTILRLYSGAYPFEDWQVDFIQMPRVPRNFKYLLVFVDTFPGCVKTLPTQMQRASEVAPVLKDLISRYGLPTSIQSGNGPLYIPEVTQQVSKTLQVEWRLHVSWRPPSMGKTETEPYFEKDHCKVISRNSLRGCWVWLSQLND